MAQFKLLDFPIKSCHLRWGRVLQSQCQWKISFFSHLSLSLLRQIFIFWEATKKSIRIRIEQQHCEDIKGYPLCNVNKILVKYLLLHPVAKCSTCEWGWGKLFFAGAMESTSARTATETPKGLCIFTLNQTIGARLQLYLTVAGNC